MRSSDKYKATSSSIMPPRRKKLKRCVPTPPPEPQIVPKPLNLILTSEKRRGFYECDYCRTDLSQVPRICCAICPEFDLCLECFIKPKASDAASAKQLSSTDVMRHDDTHGYRVCDSTRFYMFPSLRGVEQLTDANEIGRGSDTSSTVTKVADVQTEIVSEISKSDNFHNDLKQTDISAIKEIFRDSVVNQGNVTMEAQLEYTKDANKPDEVVVESDKRDEFQTDTAQQPKISTSEINSSPNDDIEMKDPVAADEGHGADNKMEEYIVPTAALDSKNTALDHNEVNCCIDKSSLLNEYEPNAMSATDYIVTDDIKNMWTVEEDLRLLDAISHLGLGNWVDVSEEVAGTSSTTNKTPKKCMERYLYDYLGKYGHILPQYTLVETPDSNGETKIAESNDGIEKRSSPNMEPNSIQRTNSDQSRLFKGNSNKLYTIVPTTSLPDYNKIWKKPYIPPIENVNIGDDVGRDLAVKAEQTYMKLISSVSNQLEADAIKKEWEKKVNTHGGPTVLPPRPEEMNTLQGSGLAGYMPRRGDFDIEWDNDAEQYLQDMEFTQNDTAEERELKIKVIKIYNERLDERERRKQFLIDRGLLDYRKKYQEDNKLPSDERDLKNRMRLFARFQTPQEHDALIQDLLVAKRLRKEIARLQMYRRMGFTSIVEAEKFELDRNRREAHRLACELLEKEEKAMMTKELGTDGLKVTSDIKRSYVKQYKQTTTSRQKRNSYEHHEVSALNENEENVPESVETVEERKQMSHENTVSLEQPVTDVPTTEKEFDVRTFPGHELLSKKELELCERLKLLPKLFNQTKDALIKESLELGLLEETRLTRRSLFKIDVEKKGDAIEFTLQPCCLPEMPHGTHMQK